MKTLRLRRTLFAWLLAASSGFLPSAAFASGETKAVKTLTHVDGRVMLRTAHSPRMELPTAGRVLAEGDALITGDKSLLELRVGETGLWRLGRRAVFISHAEGDRLMAGTALVRVPSPAGWRVESARGAALLGKGLWMLQAVDNEGLKLVCLDGPASVEALGAGPASAPDAAVEPVRLKLKPGELVFLRPGGKEFGPIVTVYLEELLATSRLVNAFPEPLAEVRRLQNLGIAQREQLKGVTNALVAGARDEKGFDVVVPKAK